MLLYTLLCFLENVSPLLLVLMRCIYREFILKLFPSPVLFLWTCPLHTPWVSILARYLKVENRGNRLLGLEVCQLSGDFIVA